MEYKPNPELERRRAEKEKNEKKVEQLDHKITRLENRIKYYEDGERKCRTHRLCTIAGTLESIAPEIKELDITEVIELLEHIFYKEEIQKLVHRSKINHDSKLRRAKEGYNEKGVAKWPAQVVNYTNKTQFLFRIEKGVLDVNDPGVNDSFKPNEIRVPFRNMVYIGDSDTDIPCMKLVNSYGGHSIGVYNAETNDKTKVYKMMRDNRIKYYMPADYTEESELDNLLKAIIDKTAANEALEDIHYNCNEETEIADKKSNEEERHKTDLMMALENSGSFATTHTVIKALSEFADWDEKDKKHLLDIAATNSQVFCILDDKDVKVFYQKIVKNMELFDETHLEIKRKVED